METCVCCGVEVPDGSQVCYACEHQYEYFDAKEFIGYDLFPKIGFKDFINVCRSLVATNK